MDGIGEWKWKSEYDRESIIAGAMKWQVDEAMTRTAIPGRARVEIFIMTGRSHQEAIQAFACQ